MLYAPYTARDRQMSNSEIKGIVVRIGSQEVLLPDLREMSPEDMKTELAMWRAMFLGIDELTRDLMYLIGKDVVIIMRNYQATRARLFGVVFRPETVIVGGPVQYYDPVEQRMKIAIAMQRIPYANILSVNEILQELGSTEAESVQEERIEAETDINGQES
jgi:hypothetical protein